MRRCLAVEPPEQGLKLLARLPPGMDDVALAAAAARRGVVARPVSPLFLAAPPVHALMLGFSGHEPGALRWAARELGAALAGDSGARSSPNADPL